MLLKGTTVTRLIALLCVFVFGAVAAQARAHKSPKSSTQASKKSASSKTHKTRKARLHRTRRPRGQQQIDSERTREIQAALIREHYLDGDATGQWDEHTKAAMLKYQADHGWQTRNTPDARALIALGLGPSQNNLLNPQTAAVSPMQPASALTSGTGLGDAPQHH